jgi:hypothetical protein
MKEEDYWVCVNNQKMLKIWSHEIHFLLTDLETTKHIKEENSYIFEGIFLEHNRLISFKMWDKVINNRFI